MEYVKDQIIKQYKNFTRHETVIPDNSMISEFKKCPRKYFYRYVLGYTTKLTPRYFPFGSAYHKFRETLELSYKVHIQTQDIQTATVNCLMEAMAAMQQCWTEQTTGVTLLDGKFEYLNLALLKKACMVGFDHWQKEKLRGQVEVLASEQSFAVPLSDGTFVGGRFDEIIVKGGKVLGRDFKTSSINPNWYKKGLIPNSQFLMYTYAESKLHGAPVAGQDVEVMFHAKTVAPKIQSFPVLPTRDQLNEWEKSTIYWVGEIRKAREEDHYPMNESACYNCDYHGVCSMPSESSRAIILKTQFRLKLWNYNEPDK